MSKAEDRYLEHFQDGRLRNCSSKESFLLGYHQAEKDLELTWEDIDIILKISPFVDEQHCDNNREFCEEVLKRFKSTERRIV